MRNRDPDSGEMAREIGRIIGESLFGLFIMILCFSVIFWISLWFFQFSCEWLPWVPKICEAAK